MRIGTQSVCFVLLLSTVGPSAAASWDPKAPPPHTFGMVAAEAGGSVLGAVAAGVALALGTVLVTDAIIEDTLSNKPGQAALAAGWVAYPFGAAAGATLAGSLVKDDGRFLPSLIWAGSTAALAGGMVLGGMALYDSSPSQKSRRTASDVMFATGMLVEFLGVPAAACIGYVKGRPATKFGGRIVPGGFAFRHSPVRDGNWEVAVEPVRVRF